MSTKKVKIKDVLEAAKANGLSLLRSDWLAEKKDGTIRAGCILGQTAYNLKVLPVNGYKEQEYKTGPLRNHDLMSQLEKFPGPPVSSIWYFSGASSVATTITRWNDARNYDDKSYKLKTYKQIYKMMEEVLAPYLDEEVELLEYEFNAGS